MPNWALVEQARYDTCQTSIKRPIYYYRVAEAHILGLSVTRDRHSGSQRTGEKGEGQADKQRSPKPV